MTEHAFRNSAIKDYIECPAKYFFAWYKSLVPTEQNINLEFGSSIHLAAEKFFKAVQSGVPLDDALKAQIITDFAIEFTAKDFGPHVQKNTTIGAALLESLFDLFYDIKPEHIMAVEKRFEKRIKGRVYTGKIDLLIKKGKDSPLIVIDHKTTSKYSQSNYDRWALSRQLVGYQWLTDADQMQVNVFHCIKGNGVDKVPRVYQLPFLFSQFKLNRWEQQTMALMDEISSRLFRLEAYLDNPRYSYVPDMLFPRLGTMCNIYGCEFQPLCAQDLPLPEILIPQDLFKEREEER